MRISLAELLAQKHLLLADGATGTNFMEMDLEPGYPPDLWNVEAPHKPRALHQRFVDAGSDIILTNTFGANAPRLKLHQAQDDTYAINKAGAEIAGEVAANSDRPVVVAGSIGPTGELFEPMGELTMESAIEAFAEQIRGLKDGGADVAWIETMSDAQEIKAAALAAKQIGLPVVFTASFDTAGKTMMGLDPAKLGDVAAMLPHPPLAYGANCGVGASDLAVSTMAMTKAAPNDVIVGKANCGIPVVKGKETIYTGTPELMADFVQLSGDAGVRIIGGCCGTSPEHIAAMRVAMDNYVKGTAPDMDAVVAKLGKLVNPPKDASELKPSRGRAARRARNSSAE